MNTYQTLKLLTPVSETNMDIIGIDGHQENGPGDIYQVRDAKNVMADPTPQPTFEGQIDVPSTDDGTNQNDKAANIKDRKKTVGGSATTSNSIKVEDGNMSGDQDGGHPEDHVDISTKKRKTRRGKPKHRKLKPYSKQRSSYPLRQKCRSMGRLMKKSTQPPAPYNTTQFLMEDHSDLPDLEQKLAEATTNSEVPVFFQKPHAPPRTRDSSFSVDSEEDYFYSSPEDEEEFLTKEFSSAYEDLHAERLSALTKSELIQEYVQLEAKLELVTKRLKCKSFQQNEELNCKTLSGTVEVEMTKKMKIFQQKIDDLMQQNEQLRRDNEALRRRERSPASSVDSESDSDSSCNSNHSGCSGCSRSDGIKRRFERVNEKIPVESNNSVKDENSAPTTLQAFPTTSGLTNGNSTSTTNAGLST